MDQKFFYHQLEQETLFDLITKFMQIGPSKAANYKCLKMSKLPLKLKLHFDLPTLPSLKCYQISTNKDENMRIAPMVGS